MQITRKFLNTLFLSFTAIALVASLSMSCKTAQKNSSEEKAINALTGSATQPICRGQITPEFETLYDSFWPSETDKADKGSIHADIGYKSYFKKILSSVPTGLLKWYFGLGGEMTLISNAKDVCSDRGNPSIMIPFSNEKGELAGCLRAIDSAQSSSKSISVSIPHLYVQISLENASPESVYTNGSNAIQGFALLASYFTSELTKSTSGDALHFGNTELEEDKQLLAFFLSDDVVTALSLGLIVEAPKFLKDVTFDKAIFDPSLDRNTRYNKFRDATNQSKVEYSKFVNLVFAQVLMADMCSDATRLQISQTGMFKSVGMQYYNATRKPFMDAVSGAPSEQMPMPTPPLSSSVQLSADVTIDVNAAPLPADEFSGLSLSGGRQFPILSSVIGFPFAVSRFLVEQRPVRTFFREYQPIRNTARFAINTVGFTGKVIVGAANTAGRVVVGTAHVAGRVIVGTVNAAGRVVHYGVVGTAHVVRATGRAAVGIITFPFRLFGR